LREEKKAYNGTDESARLTRRDGRGRLTLPKPSILRFALPRDHNGDRKQKSKGRREKKKTTKTWKRNAGGGKKGDHPETRSSGRFFSKNTRAAKVHQVSCRKGKETR